MSTVTRTTNPNGTYRYEMDGEVIYKASKVLYTHVSHYTVAGATPTLFHKTQAAAGKARGYNGWTKTSTDAIVDGDAAPATPQGPQCAACGDATCTATDAHHTVTEFAARPAHIPADQWDVMSADERDAMTAWETKMGRTAPAQPAPRVIDQWETHDGETYAYDVEGNRVIEISARTRATRWGAGSNVRSWAVIRNGVAASGRADGLRAAKRDALAALAGIDAKRPERQRTPRIGTRVVPIDGPTQFRGRSGRVEARGTGDDGVMYYTVDFGNGVNWPFTANQLNVP